MGLLDAVTGAMGQGGQGGGVAQLIPALLEMLSGGGGSGSANAAGGLGALLGRLQQGGLGDAAASWVGTGQNQEVSASQLEGALGADVLGKLASQFGIGKTEVAGQLSSALPKVVDHLTPGGQLPEGNAMPDLGQLGNLLGGLFGGSR